MCACMSSFAIASSNGNADERQLTQGINLDDKTIESLGILTGKVDVQTLWKKEVVNYAY